MRKFKKFKKFKRSLWRLMRAKVHRSGYLAHAKVIAVTGSCGKTSATYFLGKILTDDSTCFVGVHNNSRDAIKKHLSEVRKPYAYFVQETAVSEAGEMAKSVALLRPNVGIVTTIGQDHYTSFRTLNATAAEKGKLIQSLPGSGIAVLNADDPHVMGMKHLTEAKILTYGLAEEADVQASEIRSFWPERLSLSITFRGETVRIHTQLFGDLLTTSLLAAIAGALAVGVSLEQCKKSLDGIRPVHNRLSIHQNSRGAWFINDTYKAAFWGVAPVISLMKEARAPRKTVVMGSFSDLGGGSDSKRYRAMAKLGLTVADRVVFVGRPSQYITKLVTPQTQDRLFLFDSIKSAAQFIYEESIENELVMLKATSLCRLERLIWNGGKEFTCWKEACDEKNRCCECEQGGFVSHAF